MRNNKSKYQLYSSESDILSPKKLVQGIYSGFLDGRFLGWRLFVRNLSAQYRQSVLGYVWAFVPPLINSLVWIFLRGQNVFSVDETPIPYAPFVLIGVILWQVFLDSINVPLSVIGSAKSMLIKVNFPKESLILSSIYQVLFNFLVKIILLVFVFLWFDLSFTINTLLLFVGGFVTILFGVSISFLIAPMAVLYGDMQRTILVVTQFLFFLTPIIYPKPRAGIAGIITQFNPVAHVITTTRNWVTGISVESIWPFCIVFFISIILFLIGTILFKIALPHLVERIGS